MRLLTFPLILFLTLACSSKTKPDSTGITELKEESKIERSYIDLKQETADKRAVFREQYNNANQAGKNSILIEAQKYLLHVSDEYFTAWYNTPWTFHGHSQTPNEGSIACGYFVTTTLRDMGFNVPRIKWAQQASEYVIKKLSTDIKRFQSKPVKDIVTHIETSGEGLYIVGLDCHVGYIYFLGGKMSFVHANYYRPDVGVMSEPLIGRNPLNDSKYRVIGKIFDKEMVRNWLLEIPYLP